MNRSIFAGYICLSLLALNTGCRKDADQRMNDCDDEITTNSENHFLNDAIELTLRKTREDSLSPFHTSPEIDQQLVQHILGKLSVIYNAANDTSTVFYDIIHQYNIHYHGTYAFNSLVLKIADSTLENEFLTNPGSTSSTALNQITNDYGFSPQFVFPGWYHLYSTDNYNVKVLCDMLLTDPRIQSATPNMYCCDGDDIKYTMTPDYDEFIFDHGMGDCPSGCFGHHFWKIQVDNDCVISLVEEYGDPLWE